MNRPDSHLAHDHSPTIECDPHFRKVAYASLHVGTGLRFDADIVIHSSANSLLTSEVSFRRLDGNVSEQELNLLQLSPARVAELGAGAAKMPHAAFCRAFLARRCGRERCSEREDIGGAAPVG